MLESWKVGQLESWKVERVGKLDSWKFESKKSGKSEIGKVRLRKLDSVCGFSSSPRNSGSCRNTVLFLVKTGKCRRMSG